jgi:hypothetical protein
MSMFPEFEIPANQRDCVIRSVINNGGGRIEAEQMVDLMVHAVNEALDTFERVCNRHPHPGFALSAKVNGLPWLAMRAGEITAAIIETAPMMGMKLVDTPEAQRLRDKFK